MKEALYYESLPGNAAGCLLCPRRCILKPGQTGFCLNRKNLEGRLYSLNYGKAAAVHMDPMEKKPLNHFYPGEKILSLGTFGCSFNCDFCQNAKIARSSADESEFEPLLPEKAVSLTLQSGTRMLAYTYNEPFVWFEQVLETAALAKEKGILNVLVSNGYFNPEPFQELAPFIDAVNFDLKGDEKFYHQICKGELAPVLKSIESAFEKGIHIEISSLVVTGLNDHDGFFYRVIGEIAQISPAIPLHISRYFPCYRLNAPPTSLDTLRRFYDLASSKLDFVYAGNVSPDFGGQNTLCPDCKTPLILRRGYETQILPEFNRGLCNACGKRIYGRF